VKSFTKLISLPGSRAFFEKIGKKILDKNSKFSIMRMHRIHTNEVSKGSLFKGCNRAVAL
jgi:hypothetical protein